MGHYEDDDETYGDEVHAMFEKHNDEFLKHDRIPKAEKPSKSPDLCAFIYLEKRGLIEDVGMDIIAAAEHDEIFLNAKTDGMTEEDVIYLTRCGVRYDSSGPGLCMFA